MIKFTKSFFVVSVLCCMILMACNSKKGTKHVVLSLKCAETESSGNIAAATDIIKNRFIAYGIQEEDVHISVNGKLIQIDVDHVDNPERIITLSTITGDLGFWETYELKDIYNYLDEANKKLVLLLKSEDSSALKDKKSVSKNKSIEKKSPAAKETSSLLNKVKNDTKKDENFEEYAKENPLFACLQPNTVQKGDGTYSLAEGPVAGYCAITDTAKVNRYLAMEQIKLIFPRDLKFLWETKPFDDKKTMLRLIAIKISSRDGKSSIDGSMVSEASQQKGQSGNYEVSLSMNSEGARIWERFTQNNIDRSIAIVIDNYVHSYPVVQAEIKSGKSIVSGNFTKEEAEDLAIILKLHNLPVMLTVAESKITEGAK